MTELKDLGAVFASAKLLAAKATSTARTAPRGIDAPERDIDGLDEDRSVTCFDPWIIGRSDPRREYVAQQHLLREGFECWFPAGRLVKRMPQRLLPSKTRHKKRHVLIEDLRSPYPGYVFLRRLAEKSYGVQLTRLFEVEGVAGICMFGDQLATAEHWEIQLMQAKEDLGAFDRWEVAISARDFALAEIRRTEAAKRRWDNPPKAIGVLDTTHEGRIHLVEAFGRITRVVTRAGSVPIGG